MAHAMQHLTRLLCSQVYDLLEYPQNNHNDQGLSSVSSSYCIYKAEKEQAKH